MPFPGTKLDLSQIFVSLFLNEIGKDTKSEFNPMQRNFEAFVQNQKLDWKNTAFHESWPQSYERFTSLYLPRFLLYSQAFVKSQKDNFACINKEI